jgi:hypothetical protein
METEIQRLANNRTKPNDVFKNKNRKVIFVGKLNSAIGVYCLFFLHPERMYKLTGIKQIAIRFLKKGY